MRYVWTVAAGFALQGLTSVYLLVFAVWTLLFAVARGSGNAGRPAASMLRRFVAAGVLAALLLSPYLAQYVIVHETMGFARTVETRSREPGPTTWPPARAIHFDAWSRPFFDLSTSTTFPGIAALGLVVVAFSDRRNTSRCAIPDVRGVAPAAPRCQSRRCCRSIPSLHAAIPLFQAVRVLAHLGQVVLLMIAVIAGFGVASLQETWRHAAIVAGWSSALLLVVVNGEASRADRLHLVRRRAGGLRRAGEGTGRGRGRAAVPDAAAVVPEHSVHGQFDEALAAAAERLQRLPSRVVLRRSYEAMRGFPSDASLIGLHQLGVTHVVVHQKELKNGGADDRYDPFAAVASLKLLTRDADILIYRLAQ